MYEEFSMSVHFIFSSCLADHFTYGLTNVRRVLITPVLITLEIG